MSGEGYFYVHQCEQNMVAAEPNHNSLESQTAQENGKMGACKSAEHKSCQRNERISRRSFFFKLSIVSVIIGLSNMSLGTATLIEGMKMPHWVTKSAFGIWFGCFVFCTGVLGISYTLSKSKKKGNIFVFLIFVTTLSTFISLGVYAAATVHYHNVRIGHITVGCDYSTSNGTKDTQKCRTRQKSIATLLAALNGFLLVMSCIQCLVCLLLILFCSVARKCCMKLCVGHEDNFQPSFTMYPGCPYVPASSELTFGDYYVDPTPLKPQVTQKCARGTGRAHCPNKPHARKTLTQKPQFKAMESITESIESQETDCGSLPKTEHEGMAPET